MGWAARSNPRSRAGGKPAAYTSLHRFWRALSTFPTKAEYEAWVGRYPFTEGQRAQLDAMWTVQHPEPVGKEA